MNSRLNIWIADLFHDKVSINDVVPLNIGYLASALSATYGDNLQLQLFKYPQKLEKALEESKPDILAFSNYVWNTQLTAHFAKFVKRIHPEVIIVCGGPHIRIGIEGVESFIKKYPYIDVYIPFSGEYPFCLLVGQILSHGKPHSVNELYLKSGSIPGCYLSVENYDFSYIDIKKDDPNLQYGSPYLKGFLDEFLQDPHLIPIFETNRGCPYGCTYCAWGTSMLNKMRIRDLDLVISEFQYVAENCAGQPLWYVADSNFGILKRDVEIALEIRKSMTQYGHPKYLVTNWAKNSGERMVEILGILKDMGAGLIAAQSFDEEVLKKMKRTNTPIEVIKKLTDLYHKEDLEVTTDILVGAADESLNSHLDSLRTAFEMEYDRINIWNIMMLPGSEIETDQHRKEYGLRTKYRILRNCSGIYHDDYVLEFEEAIKSTNSMTEDQIDKLKLVHFLVYFLWNSSFARTLLLVGLKNHLNPLDVILFLIEDRESKLYKMILSPLYCDFKAEWFNSEQELKDFFMKRENFLKLCDGVAYPGLIWQYIAQCLLDKSIIQAVIDNISNIIAHLANIDKQLLYVAAQLSHDCLNLDITNNSTPVKRKSYEISFESFKFLKNIGAIPKSSIYHENGFNVNYECEHSKHQEIRHILIKYQFEKQPIAALCAVLVKGLLPNFIYTMVDESYN